MSDIKPYFSISRRFKAVEIKDHAALADKARHVTNFRRGEKRPVTVGKIRPPFLSTQNRNVPFSAK